MIARDDARITTRTCRAAHKPGVYWPLSKKFALVAISRDFPDVSSVHGNRRCIIHIHITSIATINGTKDTTVRWSSGENVSTVINICRVLNITSEIRRVGLVSLETCIKRKRKYSYFEELDR